MARMPAKVIAQIHTTSAGLEELFWEWILRVDGQVARRLTAVGGRRERNPWMDVAQLPARDLQALRWDHREPGRCWRASPAGTGIKPARGGNSYPLGPHIRRGYCSPVLRTPCCPGCGRAWGWWPVTAAPPGAGPTLSAAVPARPAYMNALVWKRAAGRVELMWRPRRPVTGIP